MAEDDVAAAAEAAEGKAANRAASPPAVSAPDARRKRKGLLTRIWNGVFRGRGDDYEKRLQYLSKEEASVHARMKRRAQWWRKMARNIILFSIVAEVAAVIYAIMTTRSVDLSWQMRALRVLPMFALPGLSFSIYTTLGSFIKMCERKDQKTLEKLRAERQAKIDELKEKTNYYTTQQLIQRYDLDPAAKAAAATVLASKLGADSGLKVSLEDESIKGNVHSSRSNDVELVPSGGLRNRKKNIKAHSSGSVQFGSGETTPATSPSQEEATYQGQRYVEHYKGSGPNEVGWIARLAAMLVGEDPSQSYALICGNCRMHNGLARKEDFPYVTYYCPHCHALNGPKHSEEKLPGSRYLSGNGSQPDSGDGGIARTASNTSSVASEVEGKPAVGVQEQHAEGGHEKELTQSS